MRNFVLVASLALVTFALVAPSFAAPTCGCDDDDEKVSSYDESNKSKQSDYASGECDANKVDVSSVKDGVKTQYGSDSKSANSKKGEHQECDSQLSIKGDQGSSYDAKKSSSHTKTEQANSKSDNSYYSSKADDSC